MVNFYNKFEKMYYDRLINEGWKIKGTIMKHTYINYYIELNSYPIIQVKEESKKVKYFKGFSGADMTIRNK